MEAVDYFIVDKSNLSAIASTVYKFRIAAGPVSEPTNIDDAIFMVDCEVCLISCYFGGRMRCRKLDPDRVGDKRLWKL